MPTWEERDLAHIWHPATQMKDHESHPPVIVDHAQGVWLYDAKGKAYLDIVSSWWANLLGHCNAEINAAVKEQLDKLEHVIFAGFSHEPAIRLVEALLAVVPKGLTRFHFNDNGSSSVEAALKMSFQYHLQSGHAEKKRFMCLGEGYHGETIGALSVGSMDLYAKMYQPMMMDNIHIPAPDCYRCPCGKSRGQCSCECIRFAEREFEEHAAETAALIVEPILQGAAGMRIYPAEYLRRLRELCNKHRVLLICDEIATGFGRTGKMFASEHAGISPDILCISKGLTGGYLPMSIAVTTEEIYRTFYADYGTGRAFVHSHTYAGNPLACAAALAVQHILKENRILETAAENARWLTRELQQAFAGHQNLGEMRHIGLVHALEFVDDPASKRPFDAARRIGYKIYRQGLANGIVLRPIGDTIYFNPPLNIKREELAAAIERTMAAVSAVLPR